MIPITTFAGRKVAVFGLARSGIVSAEALLAGGAEVACWDDGEAGRAAAVKAGLPLVDLKIADWSQFAALVLAPGVPLTHPKPHWTVERAKQAGVEIIGDIELFFRERAKICPECPVVAITGTNGKSTTTALIAHVLRSAGKDVQMGGNIGVGVLALEPPAKDRYFVIEMSSFQIDLTPGLKPTVGVLLNITPDHLDRHGTMENYAAVKGRILESDWSIVSIDDPYCKKLHGRFDWYTSSSVAISTEPPLILLAEETLPEGDADQFPLPFLATNSVHLIDGRLFVHSLRKFEDNSWTRFADISDVGSLRGDHNGQNAAAAFAACAHLRIPAKSIVAGFLSFPGLAHRLEELGHVGRTTIINDSKGTNADSTEKALASFPGAIYWIAGGVPKEGGIESLAPLFGRVAKAYLVGQCAPDFARTLDGKVAYELCGTLDVAIASAARDAALSTADEPVILLSPACASYDQYKSFEHRGDHFRALAEALPGFQKKRMA
jgi:UDP-N-acetylmuramoylalanine--D-glutamate ligase